ncbi:hypothetical protein ACIPH4_24470 [Streptomyces tendae]|uniref:hypothetical protein n=1 Tax=Streptomyces tendae TaxID=1932 RepID=UPI0037FB4ADB
MALLIDAWDVQARPLGWIRLKERGGGPSVFLQYERSGSPGQERFDMRAVVLKADEGDELSARLWRRIPFSQLERMFNFAPMVEVLTAPTPADVVAPTLDTLDAYFEATSETESVFGSINSDVLVSDEQEGNPPGKIPIVKPPQGRLTDDFLRDVAEAYRWFAEAKQPPAPGIADIAEVPVRTVHRWIYEARKRGILPPARTGRAG